MQNALSHLPSCPKPDGPAETYRGERPWPKGLPEQERTKEEWLAKIAGHPQTTDGDYDAAVAILVDPGLLADQVDVANLEAFGFVIVESSGRIVAQHPFGL